MKIKTPLTKDTSTVLEAPTLSNDEEGELWHHGYVIPSDHDSSPSRRWGSKNGWCRPSCIPISVILILIFLVVLLPVLDQATEKALQKLNNRHNANPSNICSVKLVESIPEGLIYPNESIRNGRTYDSWMELIDSAEQTIEIASFYWTLRQADVYPDPSSKLGQDVFDALLKVSDRGVKVRIAQNAPTRENPNTDTEILSKRKAAEVRNLNFNKLLGAGVLHTKFWIVDGKHFYIGSANMDWRALTQVKEMGMHAVNCTSMAEDLSKVFNVYWSLGVPNAVIPAKWPKDYETSINIEHPINLTLNDDIFQSYISSSPPQFSPEGRAEDIDAIVNTIRHAEKFIYISVMDYFPLMIYTPKIKLWPVIDNALRAAAVDNKVEVRLLISWWNHSRPSEDYFLKSLSAITDAYPKVTVSVRRFIVPANSDQQKIPFARVNHNKYMVTDNTAYIGTSNWSGDYFTNTAGVAFVVHDPVYNRNATESTIRSELQAVFERDWNSNYSHTIDQTDLFLH
ncbi:5'-3' exonuclease PLD3-like [Atheta coriaria]|uniref:5'-3' exonuclease PLD3-like n=1 Tax=Dalotia coriaria TaxID=877792 RepID=UPI0031F45D37